MDTEVMDQRMLAYNILLLLEEEVSLRLGLISSKFSHDLANIF